MTLDEFTNLLTCTYLFTVAACLLLLAFLAGRWYEKRRHADMISVRNEIRKLGEFVVRK